MGRNSFKRGAEQPSESLTRLVGTMRRALPVTKAAVAILMYGMPLVVLADWLSDFEFTALPLGLILRAVILVLLAAFVIFTGPAFWRGGFFAGYALSLILFTSTIYAVLSSNVSDNLYHVARMAFWIFVAVAVYRLRITQAISNRDLGRSLCITVIIGAGFTIYLMSRPDTDPGRNASAYLLLWCMPVLMYLKVVRARWILLAISTLAIMLTVKRGAIIALVASCLTYAFFSIRRSANPKHTIQVFGVLVALSVVAVLAAIFQWEAIVLRFHDTSGSGRDQLYHLVVDRWINAGATNFVFGFGINSVQEYTANFYAVRGDVGPYAHSDFIQFAHDFGLLGIALLVVLHWANLRLLRRAVGLGSEAAPAIAMGYAILLLVNIYSGHLIGPTATYFGLLLACCSADVKRTALGIDNK